MGIDKHLNLQRLTSWLFVSMFLISLSSTVFLFSPKIASANNEENLAKLCVPPLTELNKDRSEEGVGGNNDDPNDGSAEYFQPRGSWIEVIVINRSTFELKVSEDTSDTCAAPLDNLEAHIIAESMGAGSFAAAVNGILYDRQLDDTFNYRFSVDEGTSNDETILNNFSKYEGSWEIETGRIKKLADSELDSLLKSIEIVFSIEEDQLNKVGGCSGDQNQQFAFRKTGDYGNGGKIRWECRGSGKTAGPGLSVFNVLKNKENFNIVYAASDDGKTLINVAENEQEKWNFNYCGELTTDGENEFRTQCSGSEGLRIEAQPSFFNERADQEQITVDVLDNSGSKVGEVVVAGSKTNAAKYINQDAASTINTGAVGQDADSCEARVDFWLSFALCPGLALADQAVVWLDDRIISALSVDSANYENPDIKESWGDIRDIAYIVLIPVMLIMVIGTALQLSFVDPYTVKRALPRLFIAVIFIALSYDIAALMIEAVNVIGQGIAGIIAGPFGGMDELTLQRIFNPDTGNAAWFVGGVLGGIGIAFLGGVTVLTLFSVVGMAALALMIIFLLLSIRELILVFLLVISPIAIITWIFPGNDKFWKLWWNSFTKLLLLYPIIMALLATGRAFASFVGNTGDGDMIVINTIVKLVAFIGPFFFIPKAFQMAGGAFATLAGMANDRGKGVFDRQKKFRADQRKDARQRNLAGNRFRNAPEGSMRSFLNKRGQSAAQLKDAGFVPSRVRAAKRLHAAHELDAVNKDTGAMSVLANDDAANALMSGRGTKEDMIKYLMSSAANGGSGYGRDDATQIASELQLLSRNHGLESMKQAAFVQLAGSKTAYRGGPAEMLNAAYEAAGGDTQIAASLYAKARSAAEQAGRVDLAGYSYGEGLGEAQKIWQARAQGMDDAGVDSIAGGVNERLLNKVVDSKGVGAVIQSHGTAAKNLMPVLQQRLERATQDFEAARLSGDYAGMDEAHTRQMASAAEIANTFDYANFASPEVARELRDSVMTQRISYTDTAYDEIDVPVTQRVQVTNPSTGNIEYEDRPVMERIGGVMLPKMAKQRVVRKGADGKPIETTRSMSTQEFIELAKDDKDFRSIRREQQLTEEERRRMAGGGPMSII